jgi:YHS domain-containing protein
MVAANIFVQKNRIMKHLTFSLLFLLVAGTTILAQSSSQYNTQKGVAINGYDPVSYFQSNPQPGNKSIAHTYKGVRYQFSSQGNKDRFVANPEKYIPAYGGWCAYAMGATGEKVKVNPKTYKILNWKLYLFYNKYLNNTLDSWNEDEKNLKLNADKNWAKFKG